MRGKLALRIESQSGGADGQHPGVVCGRSPRPRIERVGFVAARVLDKHIDLKERRKRERPKKYEITEDAPDFEFVDNAWPHQSERGWIGDME